MSAPRLSQLEEPAGADGDRVASPSMLAFNRATAPGWPADLGGSDDVDEGDVNPPAGDPGAAMTPTEAVADDLEPVSSVLDPSDVAWLHGAGDSRATATAGPSGPPAPAAGATDTPGHRGDAQKSPTTAATLASTADWFRSVLRSMLVSYAVVLAVLGAWLFTPLGWSRLWIVPAISLPVVLRLVMHPFARRMLIQGLRVRTGRFRSVAGIAAGTAAIAASLLTIDALPRAIDSALSANASPVDVLVITPSPSARDAVYSAVAHHDDVALSQSRRGSAVVSESNDGQLDLTATAVDVSSMDGHRSVKATAFETELSRAHLFGGDTAATGLGGVSALAQDEAAVGADLAADLGVRSGDRVRVSFAGMVQEYRVVKVLQRRGLAALTLDSRSSARVLYVAPGAVSAAARVGSEVRSLIAWSCVGDASQGWKHSEVLASTVVAGIAASKAPELGSGVRVLARSADLRSRLGAPSSSLLRAANITAAILAAGGAFVILLTMLVTYRARRHDHLALRALGETRADAAGSVVADLWVLSLGAAMVGALVGHLVAGAVLAGASTRSHELGRVAFTFSSRTGVLAASFAAGFAVAMIGLYLAARVGSRSSLARAVARVESSAEHAKVMRVLLGAVFATGIISALCFVRELLRWRDARGLVALLLFAAFLGAVVTLTRIVRPWLVPWLLPVTGSLLAAGSLLALAIGDDGPRSAGTTAAAAIVAVCALTFTFALLAALGRGITSRLRTPQLVRAAGGPIVRRGSALVKRLSKSAVDEYTGSADAPARRRRVRARVLEPRPPHAWSGQLLVLFISLLAVAAFLASQVNAATAHRIADRAKLVGGRYHAVATGIGNLAALNASVGEAGVVETTGFRSAPGFALGSDGVSVALRFGVIDAPYAEIPGVVALTRRHAGGDQTLVMSVLTGGSSLLMDAALADRLGIEEGRRLSLVDPATGVTETFAVAGLMSESAGLPDVVIGQGGYEALHGSALSEVSALLRLRDGEQGVARLRSAGVPARSFKELVRAETGIAATASAIARMRALAYLFAVAELLALLGVWLWERRSELGVLRNLGAPDGVITATIVREQIPRLVEGILIGTLVSLAAVAGIVASTFDSRMAVTWLSPRSFVRDVVLVVVISAVALVVTTRVLLRKGNLSSRC